MAHKRAFSKTIIETDAFQDMSQTAQLLYFYLNMNADDDGFVGNPKRIMRAGGFGEDDFRALLSKRFLLFFESGVVVIKHWLIHNTIRKDRYYETPYLKEKKMLQIKENNAYTDHWQPNGNQLATQKKIKEYKIKKDKIKSMRRQASQSSPEQKPVVETMDLGLFQEWCDKSPHRHIQLIGDYAGIEKPDFKTKPQWQVFIRRNVRAAKQLEPFSNEDLEKAIMRIKKESSWLKKPTMETIIKFLK